VLRYRPEPYDGTHVMLARQRREALTHVTCRFGVNDTVLIEEARGA
jgi:hypothetical protein